MSCFKKSNPKVSIVVPIYNGEKYINRCLESILNQSYRDFEVILIDDGSKDSSLKKLYDYEKKDTRIRVFTQKNSGPSAARNKGIKESSGEYLIFIDIDDYVSEFYLEKNLLKMDKKTLILSNVLEIFIRKTEKRELFDKKSCSLEKIEVLKSIINGSAGLVCGKLIDLKMLKDKKILFDENIQMCEDQLFFLEVALESEEFYYENEYLYYYDRRDESSLSLRYKNDLYMNLKYIYQKILILLKTNDENLLKELKNELDTKEKSLKELAILNEFKNIKFFGINSTLKELKRINDRELVCKLFFRIKLLAPFRKIKNMVRGI